MVNNQNILIDTSPDLRYQLYKAKCTRIDAVIFTHLHSDHTSGLPDMRAMSLINNMVIGVSGGFEKELEIVGVGYQASLEGNRLRLQIGYSHDIYFDLPEGIKVTADRTIIRINGIDKQLVGSVASKIRSFRKPEPYKGKGIRYKDEYIKIKQGKTVGE